MKRLPPVSTGFLPKGFTCHCGATNWCAVVGQRSCDMPRLQSNSIRKEKCLPLGPHCWLHWPRPPCSILWKLGDGLAVFWAFLIWAAQGPHRVGRLILQSSLAGQGHTASQIESRLGPRSAGHGPMLFLLNPATSHDLQLAVNHVTKATVALDVEIITAVPTSPTHRALYNLKDPFIIIIFLGPH